MKDLIVVFIGSGLGGLTRYGIGKWIDSFHKQLFPCGTLIINVAACFILGLVIGFSNCRQTLSTAEKLFLSVGFCGGFSTFSTFSSETLTLFQQGHIIFAVLNVIGSVLLCAAAIIGGIYIGSKF